MHIGLVYDLREDILSAGGTAEEAAECDSHETIDAIFEALVALGHRVTRIGHIKNLVRALAAGERWELVFNIAEGRRGYGREAQVPAILEAYEIPYTFSDPLTMTTTLHKGVAKSLVAHAGIPTAPFAVFESAVDIEHTPFALGMTYPLFAKPVAEGTSKGVSGKSRVDSHGQLHSVVERLVSQFKQPVIVESYLPGREFTVGILGTGRTARAIGALEVMADNEIYGFADKGYDAESVRFQPVQDGEAQHASAIAVEAWRVLGCRDAGRVDIRLDDLGTPNFIEVNPLAGLNPHHSDLPVLARAHGMDFGDLIGKIVELALERSRSGSSSEDRSEEETAASATAEGRRAGYRDHAVRQRVVPMRVRA